MKLRKLQFGIAATIFLEILSSSRASYASEVENYFNQFPQNEPPIGNLKTNDLKTQNYSNATPLTQEKVISNQEFNSLDGSHNSSKIIRTGNGTILEFQQEVSKTNSTDMDEVILVKDDGILPGADAFPLNNNPRRRHPYGRFYVRESDGVIEILAKSGKKKSNQQFVINRLREIYG